MTNPRDTAFKILSKVEKDNAYSSFSVSDALSRSHFEDSRDMSLVTALVYGVLEHKLTLDYNISLYLSSPLKKLKPQVLTILRLGTCQLFYMDKIPASAAVNEAVKSAKSNGCAFAAGLINAVLHKLEKNGMILPDASDKINYLSVKYSFPVWLVRHYIHFYGEESAVKIMSASSGRRPVFIRVNTLLTDSVSLQKRLSAEGISAEFTDAEPNALIIGNTGDITRLNAYKKGLFHVQDLSSQLCCRMLGANSGDTVVDSCAAPGGKSFTIAQIMDDSGNLCSCDIYSHKTELIDKGAQRLGITCINTICSDINIVAKNIRNADAVLCDVPCSGLGVTGRKPEIKYKSEKELEALPAIQREILENCSAMVKDGGILVYSTCTLNPAENNDICEAFLQSHADFSVAQDEEYNKLCNGKFITVLPSEDGGDGFFIAKFVRKANA